NQFSDWPTYVRLNERSGTTSRHVGACEPASSRTCKRGLFPSQGALQDAAKHLRIAHVRCQIQQFDIAEVDRVALALQGDVAARQDLSVLFYIGVVVGNVSTADLGFVVGQHRVALNDVVDNRIGEYDKFRADPLVAMVGF